MLSLSFFSVFFVFCFLYLFSIASANVWVVLCSFQLYQPIPEPDFILWFAFVCMHTPLHMFIPCRWSRLFSRDLVANKWPAGDEYQYDYRRFHCLILSTLMTLNFLIIEIEEESSTCITLTLTLARMRPFCNARKFKIFAHVGTDITCVANAKWILRSLVSSQFNRVHFDDVEHWGIPKRQLNADYIINSKGRKNRNIINI